MSTTHAKAKLMVCSLRSPISPPHYVSLLSISASALLMTLQRFGMICLMMYVRPLLSTHSEGSSKPISSHKHICPDFSSPSFVSVALTLLFGAPRVCLWIEIGRYKNTIRIRIRTFVSFSSFTSILKLKTHSQLTQSLFTDCLFCLCPQISGISYAH